MNCSYCKKDVSKQFYRIQHTLNKVACIDCLLPDEIEICNNMNLEDLANTVLNIISRADKLNKIPVINYMSSHEELGDVSFSMKYIPKSEITED